MKKFVVLALLWFLMVSCFIQTKAKAEIEYEIQYDSKTEETYELKDKIEHIYTDLVHGVHKESYILMVLHNKQRFAYKKNMKVDWQHNMLVIIEGDGKGDTITGTLRSESVCVPEVQPRSLIEELLK